jgi:hypothetical protein
MTTPPQATPTPAPRRSTPSHRWWYALPVLAMLAYVLLGIDGARRDTPTVDEFAHVPAGVAYWRHGAFDLYAKNPPLFKLWMAAPLALDSSVESPDPPPIERSSGWWPWLYGEAFERANADTYLGHFFVARLMVLPVVLIAALCLLLWTRSLFGLPASCVATTLLLLSPNLIAHGRLATIDAACMASIFVAMYVLWLAHCRKRVWWMMLAAGAALGIALAVKYTAILLLPVVALLIVIGHFRDAEMKPARRAALALRDLAVLLLVATFVVNLSCGFRGSFQSLGSYTFGSSFAQGLQRMLPAATPVPLPSPYVSGFDQQKRDLEVGEFGSYLMGQWSDDGWWYYNFVAIAVKTPEPTLLLLLVGGVLWRRARVPWFETLCIAAPAAFLLLMLCAFNPLNIGIRYLLPLLPFAFIAIAAVFASQGNATPISLKRWQSVVAVIAVLSGVFYLARTHPEELRYFNMASGGPDRGADWLLDSNLDWGQDLYRVPDIKASYSPDQPIGLLYFGHVAPQIYGLEFGRDYMIIPPAPVPGILVVSENFAYGYNYVTPGPDGSMVFNGQPLTINRDHLAWLRDVKPIGRAGSLLIYDTRPMFRQ